MRPSNRFIEHEVYLRQLEGAPLPSGADATWRYAQPVLHLAAIALLGDSDQGSGREEIASPLRLARIWPQAGDHFGLAYLDAVGRRISGQWIGEPKRFRRVVEETQCAAVPPAFVLTPAVSGVMLQINADRKLPGLSPLMAQPGAACLVHHPERRAVVRQETMDGTLYAKVVRPSRAGTLAQAMEGVRRLAAGLFATPKVLAVDCDLGALTLAELEGRSWFDLLGDTQMHMAGAAAGSALRRLHELPPPAIPGVAIHDAGAEIRVVQRWLERLALLAPEFHRRCQAHAPRVYTVLDAEPAPPVLLHRDFYDKQVFVDGQGNPGLLDFDTLAVGEAALDVANALVHLELRGLQGRCTPRQVADTAAAFLAGYRLDRQVSRRIPAYADATRLRLACVYACRPTERFACEALLAHIGQPLL